MHTNMTFSVNVLTEIFSQLWKFMQDTYIAGMNLMSIFVGMIVIVISIETLILVVHRHAN